MVRRIPSGVLFVLELKMKATQEQLQALRLLRAFSEIKDPQVREAVIAFAEQARDGGHERADPRPEHDSSK